MKNAGVHGLGDADVAHPSRLGLEGAALLVSGRPNSLTSRAPDTLKRSVMVLFIWALRS